MSRRSTSWVAAVAWLGAVALAAGVVIWLRTARMNDYMSDDGNPVIPFAILFIIAILIPLAGVQRSRSWSRLAAIQAGVVAAACITLFAISPSGDGLYMLPIAIAAIAATAISVTLTIRAASSLGRQACRADRIRVGTVLPVSCSHWRVGSGSCRGRSSHARA